MTKEQKAQALRDLRIHRSTAPKLIAARVGVSTQAIYKMFAHYKAKALA